MRAESSVRVAIAVIFYCVCSGSMLLVNKLAVYHIPSPALVTLCQFTTASSVVLGGKHSGLLRDVDDFEWDKAKHFLIYVLSFALGTWTNMKVLSLANVETVIVFRSCTPIAVSVFDYYFHGRDWPNARSITSLLCIAIGALCYIVNDREFQVSPAAYRWAFAWWVVLVFQLTYGKFLVSGLQLRRSPHLPLS